MTNTGTDMTDSALGWDLVSFKYSKYHKLLQKHIPFISDTLHWESHICYFTITKSSYQQFKEIKVKTLYLLLD